MTACIGILRPVLPAASGLVFKHIRVFQFLHDRQLCPLVFDGHTLMSALAQFERDVIAERTKEGLKAARARGRKGGRPRCDPHKLRQALKLYEAGQHTVAEIEELTGIKKATLYRARKGMGS